MRSMVKKARKRVMVQILCRCPECMGVNKFVVDYNNIRPMSNCHCCGAMVPTEAYLVIALTNDMSRSFPVPGGPLVVR